MGLVGEPAMARYAATAPHHTREKKKKKKKKTKHVQKSKKKKKKKKKAYPIDDENIIDWEAHYEHTLARNIDEEELPTTVEEGVFVERQGTGYGWYHDPDSYHPLPDEVVMTFEEADQNGAHPCPRCFPESDYGSRFDVTEMPGGTTKYVQRDPEEDGR